MTLLQRLARVKAQRILSVAKWEQRVPYSSDQGSTAQHADFVKRVAVQVCRHPEFEAKLSSAQASIDHKADILRLQATNDRQAIESSLSLLRQGIKHDIDRQCDMLRKEMKEGFTALHKQMLGQWAKFWFIVAVGSLGFLTYIAKFPFEVWAKKENRKEGEH